MRGIQLGESWGDDITVSNTHQHTLETSLRSRCCVTPMKVKEGWRDGGRRLLWLLKKERNNKRVNERDEGTRSA